MNCTLRICQRYDSHLAEGVDSVAAHENRHLTKRPSDHFAIVENYNI